MLINSEKRSYLNTDNTNKNCFINQAYILGKVSVANVFEEITNFLNQQLYTTQWIGIIQVNYARMMALTEF